MDMSVQTTKEGCAGMERDVSFPILLRGHMFKRMGIFKVVNLLVVRVYV